MIMMVAQHSSSKREMFIFQLMMLVRETKDRRREKSCAVNFFFIFTMIRKKKSLRGKSSSSCLALCYECKKLCSSIVCFKIVVWDRFSGMLGFNSRDYVWLKLNSWLPGRIFLRLIFRIIFNCWEIRWTISIFLELAETIWTFFNPFDSHLKPRNTPRGRAFCFIDLRCKWN